MLVFRVTPRRGQNKGLAPQGMIQRLRRNVVAFSEPRNFWAQPRANRRICDEISHLFGELGFKVRLQGKCHNVLATPLRTERAIPFVCAHYDSTPSTPGADDNASGLAAMLEVARLAAQSRTPVGFVAFNCEEDGLAGSREFVSHILDTPMLPTTVHVLEMVGFASSEPGSQRSPIKLPFMPKIGDFIGVVANHRSLAAHKHVMRTARRTPNAPRVLGLKTYFGSDRYLPDIHRSDHSPFWRAGIPALMWTDTANFRNPHYHRDSDTPDTLNYRFLSQVTNLLARVVGVSSVHEESRCS